MAGGLIAGKGGYGRNHLVAGASLGLAFAGIGAVARHAVPSTSPLWGNLGPASAFIPFVTAALSPITGFFIQAIILLTVVYALVGKPGRAAFLIVVGLALAGSASIETIPSWLVVGATTGAVLMLAYLLAFRHEPMLVVPTTATLAVLATLRDGILHSYPAALAGAIAGALLITGAAWLWYRSREAA